MISCLQSNYRGRLARMFVVNVSLFVRAVWMLTEAFLDSIVKLKMSVSMSASPEELLELVHPSQLLKRHGGLCDLPENAWPPTLPKWVMTEESQEYHIPEEEFKKELISHPTMLPLQTSLHMQGQIVDQLKKEVYCPKKHIIWKIELREEIPLME